MFSLAKTLWNVVTSPITIAREWKNNKKKAIGIGTLVVVKTAGVLALWYNPWILVRIGLEYGLPVVGFMGPTITRAVVSGIKFVFI